MSRLRCAIYTRKSSEEGLEQSFNSLDAQREACEAYILSQKSEGWKALPALYDDGGFSGGTIDRPALKRLLQDIGAGRVDVAVVYKVDRLTRSLADFAKIVEVFDASGVSFVSVTQAFNTTSSMGRLTLNVLLSFAQFEREVTGERIRDKIAASKAKGMWMGGFVPLGYAARDRSLVVVDEEAETVRHIFRRYLALKSVNALAQDLAASGIRSKLHVSRKAQERGGGLLSRGSLFHLLRNRIYIGEIVHKKQSYPGQHEPIIEPSLFEQVERQLSANAVRRSTHRFEGALLTGRVFDALGSRMSPAHSYGKSGARYRYYVSNLSPDRRPEDQPEYASRVSATVLEDLVVDRTRRVLGQPAATWPEVLKAVRKVEVRSRSVTLDIAGVSSSTLPSDGVVDATVCALADDHIRITLPAYIQARNGCRVTAPAARLRRAHYDKQLIAALRRAHDELGRHGIIPARNASDLSDARGLGDPYLRRIAGLAFLAPDIQQAILSGRQPPGLSVKRLADDELPLDWQEQRTRFGFSEALEG